MRLVAALRSWNFLIGGAPGRLFQIATSRFAGQDFANSANSGWLLKVSNGVLVAAAASSGVACAVMWLSESIVKVVIVVVLCAAGCAVNTWITPRAGKGKAILHNIDRGEGTAMGGQSCAGYRMALLSGPGRGMHVMTATRGS
jgi:hypothetical protein